MYLGRAMACLRSKKLSTPALSATSLREVEDLLQVAEIQKMVIPIYILEFNKHINNILHYITTDIRLDIF